VVGRETGKRRVARLLTGDVASASMHSHARIALVAGPRWPVRSAGTLTVCIPHDVVQLSSVVQLSFSLALFLELGPFLGTAGMEEPKRTGFGFRIQLIGSGRHGTQRLTMNIPVGVLVLLVQVLSLHDIHYSLIGYLPRSGVWQQNRARLSATGPQIRADETHAEFVS